MLGNDLFHFLAAPLDFESRIAIKEYDGSNPFFQASTQETGHNSTTQGESLFPPSSPLQWQGTGDFAVILPSASTEGPILTESERHLMYLGRGFTCIYLTVKERELSRVQARNRKPSSRETDPWRSDFGSTSSFWDSLRIEDLEARNYEKEDDTVEYLVSAKLGELKKALVQPEDKDEISSTTSSSSEEESGEYEEVPETM
jgi:hypothetical protein